MTVRDFMLAADALREEKGLSFHVETEEGTPVPKQPTPAENRQRNQDAMSAFTAMMGGVQKGRGRRR